MSTIISAVMSDCISFIALVQRWYSQDAFSLWEVFAVSVDGAVDCDALDIVRCDTNKKGCQLCYGFGWKGGLFY